MQSPSYHTRYFLRPLLAAASVSMLVGCRAPGPIIAAEQGTIRDLREMHTAIIPLLPADQQASWTETLIAYTVRCQVIEAWMTNAGAFDQKAAEQAETQRVLAERGR